MSEQGALRRIGDIAEATGLSVRTLRYYEEIGLVSPSARTDAGHRLYSTVDVEQLYQVAFLRDLGLSLERIQDTLDRSGGDLAGVLERHLGDVDERLATERRLRRRLADLVDVVTDRGGTNAGADLLDVMEDMAMLKNTIDRRVSILVYADIEAAHDYLIRVFGLGPGELTRTPDGTVVHGEIEAGDGEFWLHPESDEFGLSSPSRLGGASATMAVMVDDVDAHHAHAVEQGATIRYAPIDQPYGYREYSAVDLEGHLWSFMKPL